MIGTMDEIAEAALRLPDQQKAELAHTLLLSLEPRDEEGVQAAWGAEITRRLRDIQEGTAKGRPAEEVFREIRARYQ